MPFAAVMQVFGLPHFAIAFLFMATGAGAAAARRGLAIGASLLAGVALCGLFYLAGGPDARPRLPLTLVALYFVVHAYRDEWHFYRRYGEEGPRRDRRHLPLLLLGLLATVAAVSWTVVALTGTPSRSLRRYVDPALLDGVGRIGLWLVPVAVLAVVAAVCLTTATRHAGLGLGRLIARDRPLWFVYLMVPVVVGVCGLFDGEFHSMVLLHVIGWWVFASLALARRRSSGGPGTLGVWRWMRSTQPGFQTLHGALVLAFLALLVTYAHSPDTFAGTPLAWVLGRDAFYYWTVMHVTTSFVPKT
jgi:hypothetical protein